MKAKLPQSSNYAIQKMDQNVLIGIVMTLTGGSANPAVAAAQIKRVRGLPRDADLSDTEFYIVFKSEHYYPSGGEGDAIGITSSRKLALDKAVEAARDDSRFSDTSILNVITGESTYVHFTKEGVLNIEDQDEIIPNWDDLPEQSPDVSE